MLLSPLSRKMGHLANSQPIKIIRFCSIELRADELRQFRYRRLMLSGDGSIQKAAVPSHWTVEQREPHADPQRHGSRQEIGGRVVDGPAVCRSLDLCCGQQRPYPLSSRPERSELERSAVQRSLLGNVFRQSPVTSRRVPHPSFGGRDRIRRSTWPGRTPGRRWIYWRPCWDSRRLKCTPAACDGC